MRRLTAVLLSLLVAGPSGAVVRAARPIVPAVPATVARLQPAGLISAMTSSALSAPPLAPAVLVSAAAVPALPPGVVAPADAPHAPETLAVPDAASEGPTAREQLDGLSAAPETGTLWTGAADERRARALLDQAHWQTFKFFMGSRVGLLRSMIKEQEVQSAGRPRAVKDLEGMWVAWRTKGYSGHLQTAGFGVADRATIRREAQTVWDRYYPQDPAAREAFRRYMERVDGHVSPGRPSNYRKLAFGAFYLTPTVHPAELPGRIDAMLSEAHLAAIAKHRAERQEAIVASFKNAVLISIREVNATLPAGKKIVALSLLGSYSIGQSTPDSDIDYQLITQDGGSDAIEPFKRALDRHWTENKLDKIEAFQFTLPSSPRVVRASFNEGYRIISPDPAAVAALSTDVFMPPAPTAWSRLRGRAFEYGYKAWILLKFRLADLRDALR